MTKSRCSWTDLIWTPNYFGQTFGLRTHARPDLRRVCVSARDVFASLVTGRCSVSAGDVSVSLLRMCQRLSQGCFCVSTTSWIEHTLFPTSVYLGDRDEKTPLRPGRIYVQTGDDQVQILYIYVAVFKTVTTSQTQQSGTKPNLTKFGNHLCMATKIGSQWLLVLSFNTWLTQGFNCWFSCQMATNNGSPHLQIRHNLSGLYLADWKWLHPIVIAFNTLCPIQFYIQWCFALHWTPWGIYFEKLLCLCLGI